ncbi:MAG: transcription antitermination factor NusB [bacterium]
MATKPKKPAAPAIASRRKTRELAFLALYQLEVGGFPLDELLWDLAEREGLVPAQKPFFRELATLAWTNRALLDALINEAASGWRVERLAKVELSIMRLAVTELCFAILEEVGAPSVVINEAVVLTKRYAGDESAKFLNGMLGKIVALPDPLATAREALDTPKVENERKVLPTRDAPVPDPFAPPPVRRMMPRSGPQRTSAPPRRPPHHE